VPVQEKEERGSRAAAGRFTLPSSLREADDGRFDDPEEVGGAMPSRSKLRVSTVSPPLPPRRASADDELPGRGRGKSLAEPSEGEQARRRAPRDSVATGNRPAPSAPPGAGRGRGLELGAAMRRSLLPIETELAEPRAQAEDRIRLRAAGRGAQLPGSFAKFAGHEPGVSDLDEPEDSAEAILAGERKSGGRRRFAMAGGDEEEQGGGCPQRNKAGRQRRVIRGNIQALQPIITAKHSS
jgi:hypothetical protein